MEIARHGRGWRLTAELWLPRPPEALWPFFGDARNLEAITPDFLRFRVLTPEPIEMGVGARIDYELRLHGVPLRWRSVISEWEPPRRFVDEQLKGPYKLWRHEHRLEPEAGGTRHRDRVTYELPGGPLAPLAHALLVRRDLERIFAYRQRALAERFGEADDPHAGAGDDG